MTIETPITILDRLKKGERITDEEIRARFQELQQAGGAVGAGVVTEDHEEQPSGSYIWPLIEKRSGFK